MAAQFYKINYKSDFVLTINSDAGWAVPFCIKFWTGMPSQAYFVGFDGENYVNCRVGETPTQLLVMFDDHHMPIGELKMQIAYHTTIEEFPDRKFDEVTNPNNVTVDIEGTEYQVMLDFTGESGAEIDFSMPSSGVMSVNGKIGHVTLSAEDVGAQPTIEDLATIRSGAAAGATAYQKPGTGIPKTDLASGVQSSLDKADAAAPQANTYTKGEVNVLVEEVVSHQTMIVTISSDGNYTADKTFAEIKSFIDNGGTVIAKDEQDGESYYYLDNYIASEVVFHRNIWGSNGFTTRSYTIDNTNTVTFDDSLHFISSDVNSSSTANLANSAAVKTVNDKVATKQDTISDLATIRSGAAAGATAVQPAELQEGLAEKQDAIEDLATIRSGAAAGATAVQPAGLTPIESALQTIESVIPSAATAQNQLADKNFVNSSIATNTANFVGTYNSLAELQVVQNPTNNDYGFVIETDAEGNEYYDRYKYVASSQQWLFEYKVESTPFTATQWAAIQSGITSALVTKLNALPTNAELQQTLDGKADAADIPTALSQLSQDSTHRTVTDSEKSTWNGKQNAISDLATIRSGAAAGATAVQPAALQEGLAGKQDTISDLATIRSGAAAGATAVQPAELQEGLAEKQDAIEDLATIRSGAAAGATAVQPAALQEGLAGKQDTISDLATIRSGAAAGATAVQPAAMNTALADKQDTINTVNVTVDNNTGTPSGSASVSGSTLTLSFQNLKGVTGATGATGPQGPQGERGLPGESGVTGDVSGFTVIQTIDPSATYGATDIAGAATVQATNQELTELKGIVNGTSGEYVSVNYDRTQAVTGSIGSNGKWQTSNESIFIAIVPGNTYKVNGESAGTHISVLKNTTHTTNVLMNYSTGYSGRIDVPSGTSREFTAPSDGNYLYVLLKSSAGYLYPTVYEMSQATEGLITLPSKVEDVESAVDNMESEVAKQTLVLFGDEPRNKKGELSKIDLSQYSAVVGLIDGEGLWINKGKSKLIPMTGISAVRVYGGTTGQIFSFLKDNTLTTGSAAHFATGYSGRNTVLAGEIIDYEVPDDCNYICTMVETTGGAARTPEIYILYYYGEGSISEQIGELRTLVDGTKTYVHDADMNKQSIYISSESEVLSGYSSACIPVSEYKQAFLNDDTTIYTLFYSFLKEAIELGVTPSFASGYAGLKSISAGGSVTIDIPEDAEYLYVSINYATYPTVTLLNPSFEEQLLEIKGDISALSEITVPLNYNEEGDGTSGIAPALNARTEGGKVVIPKGVYNITQQIVIPYRNLNIEGAVWNYPQDPNGVHPSDTGTKLSLISNQIESIFKTQSDMSGMRMSQIGFQGLATTWDYDNADGNIAEYYFNPSSIKNVGLYIGNGRFDQVSLHRLSFSGLAVGILAKYTIDANVWSEINTDGCDFGIFVDYTTCHHPKILNNITSDCVAAGIYYKTTIGQNSYGAVIDGNVLVRNASYLTAAQIAANIPQASLVLIGHSYASVSNNTIILSGVYKRRAGGENYTAYPGGIGLYFTGNYNAIRGNRIAWSTQKAAYINGNYNSITNNIVDDDHDGFEVVGNYNVISDNVFDSALTVTGNGNKVEGNVYTGNIVVSGNNNVISGDKAAVITVSGSGNKLIGFSSANITDNGTNTVIEEAG